MSLLLNQNLPTGTALGRPLPTLFKPFDLRGCHFQNRIWVSPMCQYSAPDGSLTDWHFSHFTALAIRGPSLTIIEATSVVPEGRITPFDCGLWNDDQEEKLARVVAAVHAYKQKVGIQLAHAGRKASTKPPWQMRRGLKSEIANAEDGGWPDRVSGPGADSWGAGHADPRAMSKQDITAIVAAFVSSAERAVRAGIDVVEIHAAHGYLLSSFLSAVSNERRDSYGGSLQNRTRFLLEVVNAIRKVIPSQVPLLVRISGTEWLPLNSPRAWNLESTVRLALELDTAGVDLLTISSGGVTAEQQIPRTKTYQTDIARQIRYRLRALGCSIAIGLVGRISDPQEANALLDSKEPVGDVALLGRQFLKEPSWVLRAAEQLNVKVQWPAQYQLGRYGLEAKL